MYQKNVNQCRCRVLRLVVTIAILLGSGSTSNLAALETIMVSYPSPAPFYLPVAVAIHQGFFREQNLDVKLITTLGNLTKDGMLVDAALKPLADDQLAGINPIDARYPSCSISTCYSRFSMMAANLITSFC
jgi:hypothetical protein